MVKKINRKFLLMSCFLFVILFVLMMYNLLGRDNEFVDVSISENVSDNVSSTVDFEKYNVQFVSDKNVKNILKSSIGDDRILFYLPDVDYINISSGGNYGIAYAVANPSPRGDNYFVYNWTADYSSCDFSFEEMQSWISSGFYTFGIIPKDWVDTVVVYFEFPEGLGGCNFIYNLEIARNNEFYAEKEINFLFID